MFKKPTPAPVKFFGIDLDPSDDPLALNFKIALTQHRMQNKGGFSNPYQAVTSKLEDLFSDGLCEKLEEIHVPSWLTPAPSPFKIKSMALKNRIVLPPMGMMFACADGGPSEKPIAYYEARAKGGADDDLGKA